MTIGISTGEQYEDTFSHVTADYSNTDLSGEKPVTMAAGATPQPAKKTEDRVPDRPFPPPLDVEGMEKDRQMRELMDPKPLGPLQKLSGDVLPFPIPLSQADSNRLAREKIINQGLSEGRKLKPAPVPIPGPGANTLFDGINGDNQDDMKDMLMPPLKPEFAKGKMLEKERLSSNLEDRREEPSTPLGWITNKFFNGFTPAQVKKAFLNPMTPFHKLFPEIYADKRNWKQDQGSLDLSMQAGLIDILENPAWNPGLDQTPK